MEYHTLPGTSKGESQDFSGDFILNLLMSLAWLRKLIYEKFQSRAAENQKNITEPPFGGEETKI